MQAVQTSTNPIVNPGPTFYEVLRTHALGELPTKDARTLMAYQSLVVARIGLIEAKLKGQNLFFAQVAEYNKDLRWYRTIKDELGRLLTTEFHAKS